MKCNSSNRPNPLLNFVLNTDYHSFNIQSCQSNLRIIFNAKLIAAKDIWYLEVGNFVFWEKLKKKKISQESNFSFYRFWSMNY